MNGKLFAGLKELNRLRRAALSFGFHDLFEAMASMLDRECTMLPGSAHPDAALQLTHAANVLRSEMATDIAQVILPLRTNFNQDTTWLEPSVIERCRITERKTESIIFSLVSIWTENLVKLVGSKIAFNDANMKIKVVLQ